MEGAERSRELLKEACLNCLFTADELKLTSIAFPVISSEIYGMPKDISAEVMFGAVEEYARSKATSKPVLTDVRFVIIDDPTVKVFRQEFKFRYERIDDTTAEQELARDEKSMRGPLTIKTRRHPTSPVKPYQDAAVESTGGKVSSSFEMRLAKGRTYQNKAFAHKKAPEHSWVGRNGGSKPLSFSRAVAGRLSSSSSASIKDQNLQAKTPKGKENHGRSF